MLVPFIVTRAIMTGVIMVGFRIFLPEKTLNWPTVLSRLDGIWYLRIVRDGYFFSSTTQSSMAFAPLYPMLMRWLAIPFGGSDVAAVWAGVAISNLALLLALACIVPMTRHRYGDRAADRVGWYVLICPGTIFLSTVYPMSLMLAFGAVSLLAAQQGRWRIAGAVAMLAPLVRPDGAMLLIPLLVMAWRQRATLRDTAWLLLVPISASFWAIAQWLAFGTPLALVRAQQVWDASPFVTVLHSNRAPLILGMAAFFVLLTLIGLRRLPLALSLYSVVFLAVNLSSQRLWSFPRFVVILFPCFMTLGWLGGRWKMLHASYVAFAVVLATVLTLRFGLGLWVA